MRKQRKKRAKKGEPAIITKAVTHIRLDAANSGKLAALDQLAQVFLALTQQYVTLFCTNELPNGFRAPCFLTPLSERWHRVAIQQAAGIATSWRTNRANASEDYLIELRSYSRSNCLECDQTRSCSDKGQERLFFSRVPCMSLCRPQKPPEPADVLLSSLRSHGTCRPERLPEPCRSPA